MQAKYDEFKALPLTSCQTEVTNRVQERSGREPTIHRALLRTGIAS
jgi:hypothetical protein